MLSPKKPEPTKMKNLSRRNFIQQTALAGIGLSTVGTLSSFYNAGPKMRFGLVTYQWGRDWDLPTLLANCEKTGLWGVELRTQHAHKVEINLSAAERADVKKRFADSPVTCIGYGSNFEYHSTDPAELQKNIEQTKAYIQLCKDIGATGIKVKPNNLPASVPKEKTIAQIAASFNEVGKFAKNLGQLVRVEVHGNLTQEIPNMKAIFEQVTEPNVKICWNCNPEDLLPCTGIKHRRLSLPATHEPVYRHEIQWVDTLRSPNRTQRQGAGYEGTIGGV